MDDDTARRMLDAEAERLATARDALLRERADLQGERSMDPITDPGLVEREIDDSLLHELDAELAAIDEAHRRIDEGAFGACETCGGPIGDDRLAVVPAARRCVDHQMAAEVRVVERGQSGDERGGTATVEARRHLDLVPDDDDGSHEADPTDAAGGPEEQAIHVTRT